MRVAVVASTSLFDPLFVSTSVLCPLVALRRRGHRSESVKLTGLDAMIGDGDGNSPTVVNIELRQAWDGAWYPLVGEQGEQSFASYYGDSAQYFWEMAISRTRKGVIISLHCGTSERTWQLTNLAATVSVAQMFTEPDRQAVPTFETTIANDRSYVAASALYGSAAFLASVNCRVIPAPERLLPAERSNVIRLPLSDAFVSGASNDAAVNNYHGEQPPAASSQISESECSGSSSSSDDHGAPRNTGPHPQCLPPVTDAALLNASQPLPSISTSTLQTLPHKAVQKDYSPTATPKFM